MKRASRKKKLSQHPHQPQEESKKQTRKESTRQDKVQGEFVFPQYETNEIKEAFDCFDINHNGYISVDELKEIFRIIEEEVQDDELDEMIKLADKEGDGQVNWKDFYEFVTGAAMEENIIIQNTQIPNTLQETPLKSEMPQVQIIGEGPQGNKQVEQNNVNVKPLEEIKEEKSGRSNNIEKVIEKHTEEDQSKQLPKANEKQETNIILNLFKNQMKQKDIKRIDIAEPVHVKKNIPLIIKKDTVTEPTEDINLIEPNTENILETKKKLFERAILEEKERRKAQAIPNENKYEEKHDTLSIENMMKKRISYNSDIFNRDIFISEREPVIEIHKETPHSKNSLSAKNSDKSQKEDASISDNKIKMKERNIIIEDIPKAKFEKNLSIQTEEKSIKIIETKPDIQYKRGEKMNILERREEEDFSKSSDIKQIPETKEQINPNKASDEDTDLHNKGKASVSVADSIPSISSIPDHSEKHKEKSNVIEQDHRIIQAQGEMEESINTKYITEDMYSKTKIADVKIEDVVDKEEESIHFEKKDIKSNRYISSPIVADYENDSESADVSGSLEEKALSNKAIASTITVKAQDKRNSESFKESNFLFEKEDPIAPNVNQVLPNESITLTKAYMRKIDDPEKVYNLLSPSRMNMNSKLFSLPKIPTSKFIAEELRKTHQDLKYGETTSQKESANSANDSNKESQRVKEVTGTPVYIQDTIISLHNQKGIEKFHQELKKSESLLKKEVIQNFIKQFSIMPQGIKAYYTNFKNMDVLNSDEDYEHFLKLFDLKDSLHTKAFFDKFAVKDVINIKDSLILLLNGTNLSKEEKFKFAFLCLDEESSQFLSITELQHMLQLNFLTLDQNEIKKKIKLVTDEVRKMNVYDNEVYDFDVLNEIMQRKPNYFYPI